jgi:precorrin-4/cobalt-precorrin-4 C11-methyltransferase
MIPPLPTVPPMEPGKVYLIGAGPGDPELLTLKARRLIDAADYVLYTGSLVPDVHFVGIRGEVEDSKGLTLDAMVGRMIDRARLGQRIARVHTGDPAVYGATHEQIARLEAAGIPWEVVPGVTSALAAAAVLGAELTIPEMTQTIVLSRTAGRTPMPPGEDLRDLARLGNATLCLYLSATLVEKVARELIAGGRPESTPVAVVQHATLPTQRILRGTLATIADEVRTARVRDQAMVLVGPALDPELRHQVGQHESRLYAADFSHRFRRADRTTRDDAPDDSTPLSTEPT